VSRTEKKAREFHIVTSPQRGEPLRHTIHVGSSHGDDANRRVCVCVCVYTTIYIYRTHAASQVSSIDDQSERARDRGTRRRRSRVGLVVSRDSIDSIDSTRTATIDDDDDDDDGEKCVWSSRCGAWEVRWVCVGDDVGGLSRAPGGASSDGDDVSIDGGGGETRDDWSWCDDGTCVDGCGARAGGV